MPEQKEYPPEFLISLGNSYGEMVDEFAHVAGTDQAKNLASFGIEEVVFKKVEEDLIQERIFFMLHVTDRIAFMVFGAKQREPFVLSSIRAVLKKRDPALGAVAKQFHDKVNQRALEYAAAKTVVGEPMQFDSLTGMYADKMATLLGQPLNAMIQYMFSMEATQLFKTQMEILGDYLKE